MEASHFDTVGEERKGGRVEDSFETTLRVELARDCGEGKAGLERALHGTVALVSKAMKEDAKLV